MAGVWGSASRAGFAVSAEKFHRRVYIDRRRVYSNLMNETTSPAINVAIIGPNLFDQSKGSFHVHSAECKDGKNGRKYPLAYRHEIELPSRLEVVYFVYENQIFSDNGLEDGSPEAQELAEEYLSDFYFHGCVKDLPHDVEVA